MKFNTQLVITVTLLFLAPFLKAQEGSKEKVVCLYTGQGISPKAAERLAKKLKNTDALIRSPQSFYEIKDPSHLENFLRSKEKDSVCLAVPGGNTFILTLSLGDRRQGIFRQIKGAVARGGSYLGICCGANLACSRLIDETGSRPEELLGTDLSLGLLQADACFFSHPVDRSHPDTQKGQWVSIQTADDPLKEAFPIYWNQGSHYARIRPDVCVLARYKDAKVENAPSILFGKYGQGQVVTCAVHPEFSSKAAQRSFQTDCTSSDDPNADLKRQKETLALILDKLELPLARSAELSQKK